MTLLANVVDDPCAVIVRADQPWRTLADLVAAARARPETLTYGTTGTGGDDHLTMLAFEELTGARFNHVPFTGMSQLFPQLLSGGLDVGAMNVSEALPLLREGRLRGLGQAGAERWAQMPDVPTYREQGIDLVGSSSRGFVAPGGLPAPVRDRLEAAFASALADPAFGREAERLAMPLRSDRKSTRLNSSHANISYAVFCLKKKKKHSLTSKATKPPNSPTARRNSQLMRYPVGWALWNLCGHTKTAQSL